MATNQGEISTQGQEVKAPFMMPKPDNLAGNESGVTNLIDNTQPNVNGPAAYINGDYSKENRSAKFKAPNVSDDQGAGANQY